MKWLRAEAEAEPPDSISWWRCVDARAASAVCAGTTREARRGYNVRAGPAFDRHLTLSGTSLIAPARTVFWIGDRGAD